MLGCLLLEFSPILPFLAHLFILDWCFQESTKGAVGTLHNLSHHRQCNNHDGPGERLAEAMAGCNGYPVTGAIGYSTPGSFGTWAGEERHIATVTLELPSHRSPRRCWEENRSALLVGVAGGGALEAPARRTCSGGD